MEDVNVLYVIVGSVCGPCEMQHEVIKNLDLAVDVVYIDADDADDLITKYSLTNTPSLIFNGKVLHSFTPPESLSEFIDYNIEGY